MPRPVGRPLRLLISFSPQDQELKDQLVQHLQGLVRFAGIELWAADRVRAGNDWQQEAERAFENADVALLLISSDFLASSALHDVDLRRLFARHEQGGVTVIPVILRWCYWEVHPWLRQLKPLPGSQQPVESFGKEGRDQVLTEVAKEIARRAGVLPEIATVKAEPVLDEASAMSPARPSPTPAIHPRRPMPNFPDEQTRYLSEQLASAKVRKSKLVEHDRDTSGIDREILNLKRQLREGGRLRAGDSLGDKDRYQLLDLLGRGGFASVWLARDTVRRCDVAIKVLHGNLAGDRIRVDRFKRGARIMSELEHEAVVRVLQPYGMEDGWHYFVMEYMSGGDLHQAVLKGRIGTGHAILAILRATEGLAEAHARGIVHRDVKPANILLDANVEAKLADFDLVLARDTTGGTRTGGLGTAVYSSPELMDLSTENDDSTELDPRPDVYGLGMTTVFAISRKDLPTNLIGNVERARFIEELECSEAIKAVLRRATTVAGPPAMYPDATAFHEALLDAILASTRQITATWPDSSALLSSRPIPGTAGRPHGSIPATSGQAPSSGTPRITVTTLDGGSSSGELDGGPAPLSEPGPDSAESLAPGKVINEQYVIRRSLGKGGMGEVFLADDLTTKQHVALKIVRVDGYMRGDDQLLLEEMTNAYKVSGPNVCRIYDLFNSVYGPVLKMEYIEGQTLHQHLRDQRERGGYGREELRRIASNVCDGVAAIHKADIVHGDVKPGNVMITSSPDGALGRAVVLDFGFAQDRRARPAGIPGGAHGGTANYQSPERIESTAASIEDDLYALGLTLWEMWTCTVPEPGRNPRDRPMSSQTGYDVFGGISVDEIKQIFRCLSRDPARRIPARKLRFFNPTISTGSSAAQREKLDAGDRPGGHAAKGFVRGAQSLLVTFAPNAPGLVGELFPLDRATLTLGRRADVDILLPEPSISPHHATLTWTNAAWQLADAGSSSGTFVDYPDTPVKSVKLLYSEEVQLGEVRLKLVGFGPQSPGHRRARAYLAHRDGLTGLLNRPDFVLDLAEECQFSTWAELPLSVARYEIRTLKEPASDRPTIPSLLGLRRAARGVVDAMQSVLSSLVAVTAGRTGLLGFAVVILGSKEQEGQTLVEHVIAQVQRTLPLDLELVVSIACYTPGDDPESLIAPE